jgi:DHA2 family lincomycin resistance protein-like MFS transporter
MTTDTATLSTAQLNERPEEDLGARNRLVISLLLVSAFVVILNETIMSVALPRLMSDLGVTASAAQWLTTAFLLTMAIVIPITGYLLQRLNTRPVFAAAMSLFSLGTLICAVAPGLELLVFGRVVQACGTAIMMPLLMTTVMNLVPPESRGKTMGNISIVISVAPAIGPTISGVILNYLDWRWMFLLVLPIAIGALLLGLAKIRNVGTPRYAPLDLISVVLSIIAFGGIVYGLSGFGEAAGEPGAMSPWLPLGVGLVTLGVFVTRQLSLQSKDRALLDLRTFLSRNFSLAVAMMAIAMMALFGTIILLPIYMQSVLGLEPLQAGLMLLPGGLVMGLLAPIVGRLYDRLGPAPLLIPGSVLVSAALWSLTFVSQDTSIVMLLASHFVLSIGLSLMFTPLFTSSLGSLKPALYSHGSAVIGTVQQVAGAAGIAVFVSLMAIQTASALAGGADPVAATAAGVRAGFLCGAIVSLFLVAVALFIRKPADSGMGAAHGGH